MRVSVVERAFASVQIVSHNIYLHRDERAVTEDTIPICSCAPRADEAAGCLDGCLNRSARYECTRGFCPSGDKCQNQRMQQGSTAATAVVDCNPKGAGVITLEQLSAGTFIGEYVGEVISDAEVKRRRKLVGGEVIDATKRGGMLRFMNHSCDPNCTVEKWSISGEERCGVFTMQNVKSGDELTFDYCFEQSSCSIRIPCFCGSRSCHGIIGARGPKRARLDAGLTKTPTATKRLKQTTLDAFLAPRRAVEPSQLPDD